MEDNSAVPVRVHILGIVVASCFGACASQETTTRGSDIIPPASLRSGITRLTAYKIQTTAPGMHVLDSSASSDTSAFIAGVGHERYAFKHGESGTLKPRFGGDFQLGLTFQSDQKTAATIAGSGELFFEGSFGMELFELTPKKSKSVITVGPDALIGMTTNGDAQDLNSYGGLGLAVFGTMPMGSRRAMFSIGAYPGWIDGPRFKGRTNEIEDNRGYPAFDKSGGTTIRAEIGVPYSDKGMMFVTARFQDGWETGFEIDQWSLFLGIRIDPDSIRSIFNGLLGESPKNN